MTGDTIVCVGNFWDSDMNVPIIARIHEETKAKPTIAINWFPI